MPVDTDTLYEQRSVTMEPPSENVRHNYMFPFFVNLKKKWKFTTQQIVESEE